MNPKLIGIIGGKGAMGKYFADFFERNGYQVIVSDIKTKLTNVQLAKKSDVVIVSVPIGVTEKIIAQIAPYVKRNAFFMDLTSLKVFPMNAMKESKGSYLGCHPLFGPTASVEGQMVILCKGRGDKWYKWWKDLLFKNKVEVKELTAKKHDELMAYVQALSHFSDLVLSDVLSKSGINIDDFLQYQSPPYRLKLNMMGRILNQDPNLYAQIQIQNPKSLKIMEDFLRITKDWVNVVKEKDVKKFEKRFLNSSRYLGDFKRLAMEESDFLIEQMSRKKLAEDSVLQKSKPDKSYDLVALGPENTFSSLAAKKYSPKSRVWYANSITEVFDVVKRGIVKKGIVPVENNLTGTVVETSDGLFESGLKIQEEFNLPIHHHLVALDKIDFKKVKTIYSHAQPIRQCKKYLKKHFPNASFVNMASTSSALKKVVSEKLYDMAVICSEEAAKAFRMSVLAKNIEDYKSNSTRFLIVGKKGLPVKSGKKYKTSIAFYFSADAPGTLYQVLAEFNEAEVNMTRVESSANPSIPGGYVFYVDFEGHSQDIKIKKMLSCVRKLVKGMKLFGSY